MFQPVQFGKYYLFDRVAVGGMAEIFKAKMYGVDGFEKTMVVKQILPQYSRIRDFITMFIDEAKITVSLSHGNIVPVYELGQIQGTYFISMDFVDGKNLGELLDVGIERHQQLSVPHALFIASEILSGLDYAHRKTDERGRPLHIVHRDVSPQNILISYDGEVKIVDFGIARAATKVHATDAGVVKGKFGYMSPEQAMGKDVDARSDVFAVGILLFEMLTLERLFCSEADVHTIERVKRADVPTPSRVNPALSPELDAIVFKALARYPDGRYQSASDMRLAISRLLYQLPTEASAKTVSTYLHTLFAPELKERHSQPSLQPPPPAMVQPTASRPAPVVSAPAPDPAQLLDLGSMSQPAPQNALDSALQCAEEDESIRDNFSYTGVGKKTKWLVWLVVLGLLGAALFVFRHQIGGIFENKPTERLAQKSLGTLYVNSRPSGASVYFDNQKVGTTDLRINDIDPSREYEVVLTMEGYPPFSRRVLPSDWKLDSKMVIRIIKDWTADSLK